MTVTFCTGAASCCVHSVRSTHAQRRDFDDKALVLIFSRVLRCSAGGKGGPLEIDANKQVTDGSSDVTAIGIKAYASHHVALSEPTSAYVRLPARSGSQ